MGSTETLLARRHRALGTFAELSYERPVRIASASGVWIQTTEGEKLLDVYNNVPHVGHAHPHVAAAVAEQARRAASNTRYLDEHIIAYSERLLATLPAALDCCLFVNSGSEANDVAWQLAKFHTGQTGALVMTHAYHGITDSVAALSPAIRRAGAAHVEQLAAPQVSGVEPAAAADLEAAINRLCARGHRVAAVILDGAFTSTGIHDPPPEWAVPLNTAIHAAGALIIADEVQIGLGRCGSHFWGFQRRGLHPDIVTLGKPVANGYPLGIVITRREILEAFQQATGFFSTFGGNQIAAAAGSAVLDVMEQENLLANAASTGGYFRTRLLALAARTPLLCDVRGAGLLLGAELTGHGDLSAAQFTRQILNGLRARGILTGSEGPNANVLKLRPPLPFQPQHVDQVMTALEELLLRGGP